MCEPKSRVPAGGILAGVAVAAAAGMAVTVISSILAAVSAVEAAVFLVLATVLVRELRPRRAQASQRQRVATGQVLAARAALPAPARAIEAPKLRVVPGVVMRDGETIRP